MKKRKVLFTTSFISLLLIITGIILSVTDNQKEVVPLALNPYSLILSILYHLQYYNLFFICKQSSIYAYFNVGDFHE